MSQQTTEKVLDNTNQPDNNTQIDQPPQDQQGKFYLANYWTSCCQSVEIVTDSPNWKRSDT